MWHKRSKSNWEELKLNVAVAEVQLSSQFVKNIRNWEEVKGWVELFPMCWQMTPALFLQSFIKYLTHLEALSPSRFVNDHLRRCGSHDSGGRSGGGHRRLGSSSGGRAMTGEETLH